METSISPKRLAELQQSGAKLDLIDVRTPVEYGEVHINFARNLPLDRLDVNAIASARNGATQEPLYVVCRSGNRAKQACEKLAAAGLKAINVEGGTLAWDEAGLPVIRGSKVVSLERQVRIAAGALVVIGATLGYFVSPAWIGLSAFVGAGLVFAGITDTCGMGMMLAKMPWNQAPSIGSGTKDSSAKGCSVESTPSCCK